VTGQDTGAKTGSFIPPSFGVFPGNGFAPGISLGRERARLQDELTGTPVWQSLFGHGILRKRVEKSQATNLSFLRGFGFSRLSTNREEYQVGKKVKRKAYQFRRRERQDKSTHRRGRHKRDPSSINPSQWHRRGCTRGHREREKTKEGEMY